MSFFFKKFISQFFMPIPLVIEVFLFGWLLMRFFRFKRTGRGIVICSFVLFLLFGYGVGAERYIYQLERIYLPVKLDGEGFEQLKGAKIVVLGQGVAENSDLALRYQTGSSFQMRLQEGMRLYRKIPDAQMIVSLAGAVNSKKKEAFLDEYAQEHDLKRAGIQMITSARDTSDEARLAIDLLRTNRLVIVTSAAHLPRAVKIFSKELTRRKMPHTVISEGTLALAGSPLQSEVLLVPAPCDYLCPTRPDPRFKLRLWDLPLPSADGLSQTQHAFYEGLGNLYEDLTD